VKTICFVLPRLGVWDGIHVVLQWAKGLVAGGYAVDVAVPQEQGAVSSLRTITYEQAGAKEYEVVIATGWETLLACTTIPGRKYVYFTQALENQLYSADHPYQEISTRFAQLDINVLCNASWMKPFCVGHLGIPAERVFAVLNGLDRAHWTPTAPLVPKSHRPRFLVEGSVEDARKNILQTIGILESARAEYLWAGTTVDPSLVGEHCVGLIEAVPYRQMPALYSSCDVLLKLSSAEESFAGPLEMFATGGTAISWDVPEANDCMAHRDNALLVPRNSLAGATRAIRELAAQPNLLRRLQANAWRTAEAWPSWDQQAPLMLQTVQDFHETSLAPFRNALEEILLDRHCGEILLATDRLVRDYSPRPVPLRYRVVDRLCAILRRIPGALPALRLGLQGAWKACGLVRRALRSLSRTSPSAETPRTISNRRFQNSVAAPSFDSRAA
jgi:hypothetical protein